MPRALLVRTDQTCRLRAKVRVRAAQDESFALRCSESALSRTASSCAVALLLLGLVAYPFFYAIFVSFTSRVVGNAGEWIGLGNFRYLLRLARLRQRDLEHHRARRRHRRLQAAHRPRACAAGQPAPARARRVPLVPDAAVGDAGLRRLPHLARALSADRRRHQSRAHRDRALSRTSSTGSASARPRCRRSSPPRSGAASRSGSSAFSLRCRRSRQSSTRPRASTAPMPGSASAR